MNSKRKIELIEYINLMRRLLGDGFQCNNELNKAVKELQDIMFPAEKKTKKSIVIMEDSMYNFLQTVDYYTMIFGYEEFEKGKKTKSQYFNNDEVSLRVLFVEKESDKDRYRGLSAHKVINNTSDKKFDNYIREIK